MKQNYRWVANMGAGFLMVLSLPAIADSSATTLTCPSPYEVECATTGKMLCKTVDSSGFSAPDLGSGTIAPGTFFGGAYIGGDGNLICNYGGSDMSWSGVLVSSGHDFKKFTAQGGGAGWCNQRTASGCTATSE